MFKRVQIAAAALVAGVMVAAPVQSQEELRVGTASQGGAFYPVGQAISNLVNEHADGLSMVPIVTQGAVQNPRLVDSGEVNYGITNENLAYFAVNGEGPYDTALNVRGVAALHPSVLHMVTLADSDIQEFSDLEGKRVAVGPAGGGTLSYLQRLLDAHDMSMDDITPSMLSYADGFSQLGDGNVDAALALAGYPASAITQTQATQDIRFIEVADDVVERMLDDYPYYTRIDVPAEAYDTDGSVQMFGVNNVLIANGDADEDEVFAVTRAVFDNLEQFRDENANARQVDPSTTNQLAFPLHPGAERYFGAD